MKILMHKSKFKSTFEPRRKFLDNFPLRSGASFLRKPVYGRIFACPFALHSPSLPVIASSLPKLWNAQGDYCHKLEQLHPLAKCLESEVCWGTRARGDR